MEVVILSTQREEADRLVAELSLNGTPGRFMVEFRPGSSEIRNYHPDPRIDGTREGKEIEWVLARLGQGEKIPLPHRVDVADRWPSWPSADDHSPSGPADMPHEVVLLSVQESGPGMWTASLLVDGETERVVIELPEQQGRRMYHEISARLSTAKELDRVYQAVVQVSRGERLPYALRISEAAISERPPE